MRLEVQPEKCEVLVPSQLEPAAVEALSNKGLCLVRGALPLLGSVVGVEAESVQHWVANEIKSWRRCYLCLLARSFLSSCHFC